MLALVAKVVVTADVGVSRAGGFNVMSLGLLDAAAVARGCRDSCMRVASVVLVVAAKVGIAHSHELEKVHEEDGHQRDTLWPGVCGNDARQALVGQGLVCWRKEMDECRSNNDTGSKVLCNEKDPVRHKLVAAAPCKHGEHGTCASLVLGVARNRVVRTKRRCHEDDKNGRYAGAHAPVIVVGSCALGHGGGMAVETGESSRLGNLGGDEIGQEMWMGSSFIQSADGEMGKIWLRMSRSRGQTTEADGPLVRKPLMGLNMHKGLVVARRVVACRSWVTTGTIYGVYVDSSVP